MNNIDKQYQDLLQDIIDNGIVKKDRTGTGTKSVFGRQIRHKMSEGFPLLTTKRMAWKTMITELLWFLKGDTNIKYLVDNNCHIWDGDAYKRYVKWVESPENQNNKNEIVKIPMSKEDFIKTIKGDDEIVKKMGKRYCDGFAKMWGELGPIYGKQWRQWQGWMEYDGDKKGSIWYDQIQRLITDLNQNPDSRRLMVSAWNVGELDQMVLPPCHYGFQVYTRELSFDERYKIYTKSDKTWEEGGGNAYGKINGLDMMDDAGVPKRAISLMWNQRSVDTFLGLPFNIASYGLLLSLIAKVVNMVPDELIGNLGDTHLYLNHIDQAIEQKSRQPYELPWVKLNFEFTYLDGYIVDWEKIDINKIELFNYLCHPPIKAPLSN